MDELYILGCLFLVFSLVVAPVLAVIGFNRSTAARQEIARLRQRIEAPRRWRRQRRWQKPLPHLSIPGVPNRPSLKQNQRLYRRQNGLPPLAASCPR